MHTPAGPEQQGPRGQGGLGVRRGLSLGLVGLLGGWLAGLLRGPKR